MNVMLDDIKMAIKTYLVDILPSNQLKTSETTNWNLCILFQNDTGASLQCPVNTLRAPTSDGYVSLASLLANFSILSYKEVNVGNYVPSSTMSLQIFFNAIPIIRFCNIYIH